MDPWMDATSAISERPWDWKPKSLNLDCRFGNMTLSSLALPIFDFGSSCSRSIENLADKPFIPLLNVFDVLTGGTASGSVSDEARTNDSDDSFAFFFARKRFILNALTQSFVFPGKSAKLGRIIIPLLQASTLTTLI